MRYMASSGDWIVPRFYNLKPFWGKPPLYFWAGALSIHLFGATELAVRLPSFLFSVATIILMYWGLRDRLSQEVRLRACFILSTMGLFYVLSGIALTDSALSFAVAFAIFGYLGARSNFASFILLAVGTTLAILAKGALPLLIICPVIFLLTRYLPLKSLSIGIGGVFVGILGSIPWHLAAEHVTPGFLNYYLIGEHFLRFIKPGWESLYGNAHIHPKGMIWIFLLGSLIPWIFPFLWQWKKEARIPLFLKSALAVPFIAWGVTIPLIFTFASGIMMPYILPVLPAWGVLLAMSINLSRKDFFRFGSVLPVGFTLVVCIIFPLIASRRSESGLVSSFLSQSEEVTGRLNYVGKIPYSAEFYTEGNSEQLTELSQIDISKRLHDALHDYYAIEKTNSSALAIARESVNLEKVTSSYKRELFRERQR
jgi:4-amino-4-deoxy-L-arabinose transferase-like glycosyltransferase